MLKSILFTHTDLDGAGCAVLFDCLLNHRGMQKGLDYLIFNVDASNLYETVTSTIASPEVNENTEIVFADLCCGEALMKRLTERFKTIRVFDHHQTNYWVNDFEGIDAHVHEHNSEGGLESGTSIMWTNYRNELNNPVIIKFVNAVRSYDTFEFKSVENPDAIKLNKLFSILGMSAFCSTYEALLRIENPKGNTRFSSVIDASNDIGDEPIGIINPTLEFVVDNSLKLEREKIDRVIDGIERRCMHFDATIDDKKCIIFNLIPDLNMSDLGAEYLTAHPEYDVFIWFDLNRKGYSIRSIRNDVDVSKIASRLGGGGHPRASGAAMSQKVIDDFKSKIIENLG